MKRLLAFTTLCLGLIAAPAFADVSAEQLVRSTSHDVMDILKKEKDARKAQEQVQARVLPNFDFTRMTGLAVGRRWRDATPEQRSQLTGQFQNLLVRTYSSTLTTYKTENIEIKPAVVSDSTTDVNVNTEVKVSGQQPVSINYALRKTDQGWKVYDVIVGGISLVTNYRGSFNETIKNVGIDGLIKQLEDKNSHAVSDTNDKIKS